MGFSIDQHPHVFSYWEHIYYKRQQKEIKSNNFFCFFSAIFSCPTSLCLISYIKKSNSKSIFFWGMHAAMYGVIMESSKPNTQRRTNLGLHVVQHTKVSQKAKTNGGGNNVKDHKGKNSASTYSIKSSSLFIPVMLLFGYLF